MARQSKETKSKKSLIAAFGDSYSILEHDGGYLLYDKERKSKRSNHYYLGKFYISSSGSKYSFRDNYYDNKDSLIEAIEDYNKTLPFDAENFNPMYIKNYVIECCLYDYLSDLGFKHKWDGESAEYVLEDLYGQVICAINIEVEMNTTKGKIRRLIPNSNKWTEAIFEDLDSAIGAVNSILSCYCLAIHAKTTEIINTMTNSRCSQVLDKTFDIQTLTEYTEDAKEKTIAYLEAELKKLKS